MIRIRTELAAAAGILRRDWLIFISYRMRFAAQLLSSFFSLTLFYYVSRLVRVAPFESPGAYYAFAVVGLVILTVLNSTLATPPGRVTQELVAGTFERLYLSPFGPFGALVSMLLFPFVFAMVNAIAMLAFAGLVFGLDLHWSTAPLAIPLSVLGSLSFMPFGIMLLASVILVKQAQSGTTWVVAGISLIGGLYFPISLLPDWIAWAAHVQPFTPATELLRHVLVGTPLTDPVWLELTKIIGFTAVLLPVSLVLVRLALTSGRRRGTLIEY
jgi:ABC-2 type transport system permease protein